MTATKRRSRAKPPAEPAPAKVSLMDAIDRIAGEFRAVNSDRPIAIAVTMHGWAIGAAGSEGPHFGATRVVVAADIDRDRLFRDVPMPAAPSADPAPPSGDSTAEGTEPTQPTTEGAPACPSPSASPA